MKEGMPEKPRKKVSPIVILTIVIAVVCLFSVILAGSDRLTSFLDGRQVQAEIGDDSISGPDDPGFYLNSYSKADFQKPVIGEALQEQKLDVLEVPVSVIVTNTQKGAFNLSFLEKNQIIQYRGIAYYMCDLSGMNDSDIEVDMDGKKVTITIPQPALDHVDVDSDQTEKLTEQNGALAFGSIKLTVEESSRLESQAKQEMIEQLEKTGVLDQAESVAKMSAQNIFEPVIRSVASDYTVEIQLSKEN